MSTKRDRDGLVFVLFLIVCGALYLVFSYRAQVVQFKHDYYQQCIDRKSYDASSQHVRAVSKQYWLDYIETEKTNPYIGEPLRQKRITGAQHMVDALTDTLSKTVPGGCDQYRS